MTEGKDANDTPGNQRVTNALLKSSIEHVGSMVAEVRDEQRRCFGDHEGRLRALEGNQREVLTLIKGLKENQDDQRKNSNRNDGIVGGILFGLMVATDYVKDALSK